MHDRLPALLPMVALVLGGAGIYLNLAFPLDRRSRRLGAGLAGLSFAMLVLLFFRHQTWWPAPELESGVAFVVFALLAGLSLASAGVTIAGPNAVSSVLGFLGMLLANIGLSLFQGAGGVAAALFLYGILVAVPCLLLAVAAEWWKTGPYEQSAHEPFLVCVTGVLLAGALLGTLRDVQPLNSGLIVGTLLFALGTIGFLSRRNLVVMVLAAGMLLQGIALTLTAFSASHGTGAGRMLAWVALVVAAVQGVCALVLIFKVETPQEAEEPA